MRLLLYLIVSSLCLTGLGQNVYFNNANQTEGAQDYYRSVFLVDSGYMLQGGLVTDSTGFLFRKHSLDGEIIESVSILPDQSGIYWIPPRSMVYSYPDSTSYVFSAAFIGQSQVGFLMKLDTELDTVWTKYYNLDPDGSTFFDAAVVHDNHLILVAECSNFSGGDYSNRLRIAKIDFEGNLIWNKVVDDALQWELNIPRFIEISENGFIVGAGRLWYTGTEFEATTLVRKTDFEGDLVWSFDSEYYPNLHGEAESGILVHSGSRLFTANTLGHTETEPGTEIYYVDLVIRELDQSTGVELENWQLAPAVDLAYHSVFGLVESPDEQMIVLLGNVLNNGTQPYLMKIDTLGNVLWEHEYSYQAEENWMRQSLTDIKPTPDGGYIMAGELRHADAPGERWSWVVKVDGCGDVEWQGCDTSTVGLREEASIDFSLYPNPASDYIIVELSDWTGSFDIEITDLLGRVQLRTNAQSGQPIDIRELESGSYLMTVSNKGELVLSESIRIE